MVPARSEDRYPKEDIYSEPVERTENCREAQSRCSFDDQDNEMNIYSYNHLHEKPMQTCEDVYDVANPNFSIFRPLRLIFRMFIIHIARRSLKVDLIQNYRPFHEEHISFKRTF